MKIKLDNLTVNYIPDDYSSSSKSTIMFLHGFTGSCEDWRFLFEQLDEKYSPLAVDLPGHGETSAPDRIDPYREESIVDMIGRIIEELNISSLVLCGYSMGGRAALSFAVKYPDKLDGLILESTTAGIEAEEERSVRVEDDIKLADRILNIGIEDFIEEWYNKALFKSLHDNQMLYRRLMESRKNNNPAGLANSLRGFSAGKMNYHGDSLNKIKVPVQLITGEKDLKFSGINKYMQQLLPDAQHISVKSAGHNVHLENEREFIILLNSFLSKL